MTEPCTTCPICQRQLNENAASILVAQPEGPPKRTHEVCYLRAAATEKDQMLQHLGAALAGLVVKLGGTVWIHDDDVKKGIADGGGGVSVRRDGDYTIVFIGEEKRVVLAGFGKEPR